MPKDTRQIERYRGIVKFLDHTIRNIAIYPPEHPSVKGVVKRAFDLMNEVFEGTDQLLIGIINGVLYVDDYFFYEPTPYSENLMEILAAFEIDDLVITKGVSEKDLLSLSDILKSRDRSRDTFT